MGEGHQVEIDLPGVPPSTNRLYFTRNGRRRLSDEGKRYKRKIAMKVAKEFPCVGPFENSDAFSLTIELHMEVLTRSKGAKNRYKRFDVSNRVKVLEDAICESLGIDDSQVMELRICKMHTTDPERTVVTLRRLPSSTPSQNSDSSASTSGSE